MRGQKVRVYCHELVSSLPLSSDQLILTLLLNREAEIVGYTCTCTCMYESALLSYSASMHAQCWIIEAGEMLCISVNTHPHTHICVSYS